MPTRRRPAGEPTPHPHHFQHADFLRFWHVCENAACRRARACRGDIRTCGRRNFRRLPEAMQRWYACFVTGREEGLLFEETLARLAETSVADAYVNWCARVDAEDGLA